MLSGTLDFCTIPPLRAQSPGTNFLCPKREHSTTAKDFLPLPQPLSSSAAIAAPGIGLRKHHRSDTEGKQALPEVASRPASWPRLQRVLRMCLPEPCGRLGTPGTCTPRTSGYAPTVAGRHLQPSTIRFRGVSAETPAWASSLGLVFCKELRAGC